jgi:hypothetical protein
MCTVTFIPSGNAYYFTSSRDELSGRPPASIPLLYEINGCRIIYPRDPQGGGSWIAVHESGHIAVLLNGAIKPHHSEPPYSKSRGIVLLDLISDKSPADSFEEMNFEGIEPFTVILFEDKKLYAGKWDGRMKWMESLNPNKSQIWSSVTLYDTAAIQKRESWFNKWMNEIPYPGTMDIIHFHQKGGDGDPFNNILMNRNNQLFTNSISSIRLTPETASFRYIDLRNGETNETILPLQKTIFVKA